jgi:chromosome segregation ATPase
LSFSSAPRGARSGGKGAPTKKAKKQKREFRTNKKRPGKEEKVDFGAAKTRVLEGLVHLGQQKFSTGPGGYDLKHWLKSLNLLLDDFEIKMKKEDLPSGYLEKREEITSRFSAGVDTSKIESEVEAIRKEESEITATLDRERERIGARLNTLRVEKEGNVKEIEQQKTALEEIRAKRKSTSFFSRLAGKSGPPTEPVEQKMRELDKASASLQEEALNLQSVRASIEREGGTPSGLYEQQWIRLDAIGTRLKELEAEMQDRSQLVKEREAAAGALADIISKLEPKESPEQKE